jgi:hypothetical protein
VAAFLRAVAERVERDAAFGATVGTLLSESGLLASPVSQEAPAGPPRAAHGRQPMQGANPADTPDPFALLRQEGEAALRSRLAELDLATLRQIVRRYRLDPARVAARWTARERLVALIVDQVRARSDHGKAFARV